MNNITAIKIKHQDAFKLMEYRCINCGCSEIIWNSNNSASPHSVNCQVCDGSSHHIDFYKDQFRPDFKPSKGMRYFAYFTKDRAEEVARKKIATFVGTEFEVTKGTDAYKRTFDILVYALLNKSVSMDIITA